MADDLQGTLRIRAEADVADAQAKTEALKESISGVAAAQTDATAASEEQAAATAQVTLEQTRQQAILEQHAVLLRAVVEAQQQAAASVAAMADAAKVGGATYQTAIQEATSATAALEIAIQSVRDLGGPVPPTAIPELEAYDAAVRAATQATESAGTSNKAASIGVGLFRDSLGGVGRALATLGGAVGEFLLPLGLLIVSVDLLPRLWEKANEGAKALFQGLVDLVNGFNDSDVAVRKSNESYEVYQARLKGIVDTQEQFQRAQLAMAAGLIEEEADQKLAIAAWQGHLAAINGTVEAYPAFVARLKEMGLSFRATFSEMQNEAQTFGQAYQAVLVRDGVAGANAWAAANAAALKKILDYYQEAGKSIPEELSKIAAAVKVVAAEEAKRAKALDEQNKKIVDSALAEDKLSDAKRRATETIQAQSRAFTASTVEIEKHRQTAIKAAEDEEAKTVAAVNAEIAALNNRYTEAERGDSEYRSAYAAIQEQLLDARRKREAEEAKIDAEAQARQADAQAKFSAQSADYEAKLLKLGAAFASIDPDIDGFNARIHTAAQRMAIAKENAQSLSESLQLIADRSIPAVNAALGGLDTALSTPLERLHTMNDAARELFGEEDVGLAGVVSPVLNVD